MRFSRLSVTILCALALSSGGALAEVDLTGKTLTAKNASITLEVGGKLSGTVGGSDLSGTWEIKDGKMCRTISKPEKFAGSECQGLKIQGNEVEFTRKDGSTITYKIN